MLVATMRSGAMSFSTQSVIALSWFVAKLAVAAPPPQWAMFGTMNSRAKSVARPLMCRSMLRYQRAIAAPEKMPSLTEEEMISLPPRALNGRRSVETAAMKSMLLSG